MAFPLAPAVWGFIVGIIPGLIRSLLLLLGISAITYTGISAGTDALFTFASTQFSGLPAHALALVGMLRIDVAINMVISAYAGAISLQGLTRWRTGRTGVFTPSA